MTSGRDQEVAVAPPVPGMAQVLAPLEKELGRAVFRLLLIEIGHRQASEAGDLSCSGGDVTTAARLASWGDAMREAGWGSFQLHELDVSRRHVRWRVAAPPELECQRDLQPEQRWGCPILLGAILWACGRAMGVRCWGSETCDYRSERGVVEFLVEARDTTIADELTALRREMLQPQGDPSRATRVQHTRELEQARDILRTRALDLRQEIEEHERNERIKDEIIDVVNHELRTPLTSVRGFAELLRDRELSRETQVEYAAIVCAEAERLSGLLDNFLDVRRLEAGVDVYSMEPVDIDVLIHEIAALFAASTHLVAIEVTAGLPIVHGDRQRLHQVLVNLVSNAIKYSPSGRRVEIRATTVAGGVEIAVRDEGVGIPADELPHLFQMFYRIDDPAVRSVGGTGLGLAIVRRIVEGHGGRVTVDSSPGKGSTFRVFLPVVGTAPEPDSVA